MFPAATKPVGLPCEPDTWWRALLLFALTTGWRIEETMSFRRDDLNLETGEIITRAGRNKGKRDDIDHLPEITLQHLRRVVCFAPTVFYWPLDRRTLDSEFHAIQKAAGIHLPCPKADEHECTDACHRYGVPFPPASLRHVERRYNGCPRAAKEDPAQVVQTTLRYIRLAEKMKKTKEQVFITEFLIDRKAN